MAFINLVLTTDGMALYAKAQQGKPLHFTRVALGDGLLGGGSLVNRSALISERMSMSIDAIQLVEDSITAAVIATLSNEGMSQGFYARELGVFAEDPDTHQEKSYLYSHAGSDGEYIPDGNSGTLVYERLKLLIKLENTGNVTFEASGNPLYLSAEDVEPIIQAYVGDLVDLNTEEKSNIVGAINEVKSGVSGMDAKIPAGTATALTVTLPNVTAYRAGMKVTIIATSNNGSAATTLKINSLAALPVYKPNTTTAPTMKTGKPYTFILNSDLTHFFIEASAEGDAVAANVLAGKFFSNDDDTGLIGTMTDRGAATITPGTANQAIPVGYHNGNGYVVGDPDLISTNIKAGANIFGVAGNANVVDTSAGDATAAQILSGKKAYVDGALVAGTIPSKTAATITPGTANQTIASGQYLSGIQTIAGDADLVAANIKSGIDIFGVPGTAKVASHYEAGSCTVVTANSTLYVYTLTMTFANEPLMIALFNNMSSGYSGTFFMYDFVNNIKLGRSTASSRIYTLTDELTVSYDIATKTAVFTIDYSSNSYTFGPTMVWHCLEM